MQIPIEVRRRPPERTLEWVAAQVSPTARVTRVRRLRNAWASAMHAIDVDDGQKTHRLVLRRWARTDLPPDIGVVENEQAALAVAAAADVPTPRIVGADAAAVPTDGPAGPVTRPPRPHIPAPPQLHAEPRG